VLEDVAIDFRKLMKEEKRRAREKRRQEASNKHDAVNEKASEDTTSNNKINEKKDTDDSLNDWPTDWLSNESLQPFSPDYTSTKPATVLYKSQFLNDDFCNKLADWLQSLPESTCQNDVIGTWNTMKYAKRRVAMLEQPLPLALEQIAEMLVCVGIFSPQDKPNHVLVNEYSNNQGILPHTDGPLYVPKTATISIGSQVLLYFKKRLSTQDIGMVENPVELQVLLESGSLVVFSEDAYVKYCHGIDDVLVEYASMDCLNAKEETRVSRGHRISLTFRHKLL